MKKFGIDISRWQGNFDLSKAIKNEEIEFVIIKAGGADAGKYQDSQFANNYKKATDNNLPKGCYYFGCAFSKEDAIAEADHFLSIIKGKKFEYPVYYDVEAKMLSANNLTDVIMAFLQRVQSAGFKVGLYTSVSHMNSMLDMKKIASIGTSIWGAQWTSTEPSLKSGVKIDIWQFGGETNKIRTNKVNGQTVDQDYCYVDFGSSSTPITPSKKSNEEIADEVLKGLWGNGVDRKNRLTSAGYDYTTIQSIVNDKCNKKPTTPKKSNEEVAQEVLKGLWGNGTERKSKLEAEGYNYSEVQSIVNKLVAQTSNKKSNEEIAKEVLQGKWGNGADRKNRLTAAGYDYTTIQQLVNKLAK